MKTKTQVKHATSPWDFTVVKLQGEGAFKRVFLGSDKAGGLGELYTDYEGWEANARLIQAAPDLLAALRRHTAVSSCDGHGCTGSGHGVDDCPHCQGRLAVAKADGQ